MSLAGLFCLLSISAVLAVDQTRQPGAVGPDVVEAVVNLIRKSCLFADDKRFLRRLAYVETQDGTAPKTYRLGYDGGIWQVDQSMFLETQQNAQALSAQYSVILSDFGIDWSLVQWSDLRKPLYSGIAAALYTILKGGVGWRIEDQAQFWQTHYHSFGGNNFTNLANILDLGCRGNEKIDLVFVVDSSNSLSIDDFLRAKYFVQDVIKDFQIAPDKTRVAVVTYDSHVRTEFYLNSHTTNTAVKNAIDNMVFNGGTTKTAEALDLSLRNVFSTAHGSRNSAVKVLLVITDGESDDRINTMHAAERLHQAGVVVFSIGVGTQVNHNELNTIASNPGCTHVFTVSNYTEIKAIKEEVQKSSCIAPLYINSTYSCIVGHCPPLAVLTKPGGVSIETNVTCGHINVYTAFSNPYPSQAFYEVVKDTSTGHPITIFRNSSIDQTLFINLLDALKSTNGSKGCTVYITPYTGDRTDHSVKCYRDGIQTKCPETDCKEKWNFQSPCTPENLRANKTRFPYPYDTTKYIQCDNRGKTYIVQCPQHESYYQSCQQCVGADTPCIENKIPLPSQVYNPCSVENILALKFFFPYTADPHKFIHCDVWGKAWLMICPAGEEWDQKRLTCTVPSAITNPCHNIGLNGPFYFEYPCDPHRYIQCDQWHESFTRTCQLNWVFYPAAHSCVPRQQYNPTTPPPGTSCDGNSGITASHTSGVTAIPVTSGPTGSSGGFVYCRTGTLGCPTFSSPCTKANMQNSKYLFPVFNDKHHYIQCDPLSGYMYLRTCTNNGNDFFDPITQTCTDGPLAVDNSIGR